MSDPAGPAERLPADRGSRLGLIVVALGTAQIISWGTLFYSIAVLGASMRRDLDVTDGVLFGSFSIGLALAGFVAPRIGRGIDAGHGHRVLAGGSIVAALAMVILALAHGTVMLFAGWITAGMAMAMCLYDPAFAVLNRIGASSFRRAVTALTLFGGFASTVFWPLSQILLETIGWRATFACFAALHLAVCLPLHWVFVPRRGSPGPEHASSQSPQDAPEAGRASHSATFFWLALALSLANFLASALSAHLIGILTTGGLAVRDAVMIGAMFGPMQVAGRIALLASTHLLRPRTFGTLAFALFALGMVALTQVRGNLAIAAAFAVCYGAGNGLMTIVRGTVPEELFGRRGYGALLGRLARPQLIARAIAPVALALVFPFDPDRELVVTMIAITGIAAWLCYAGALSTRRPE